MRCTILLINGIVILSLTILYMMREREYTLIIAIVLSGIFSFALFYLSLEAPRILDHLLRKYFPDVFFYPEIRESIIESLRPYGYSALGIVITLIIIGFITKKQSLSSLGSLVLYLPTFGYFASAMFFLAGIGVLRALWLPIIEYAPIVLKLGHIVLFPFIILRIFIHDLSWVRSLALFIMGFGIFIFSLGVATWLYGRFKGVKIIDFWIYRYSRHPQYLGFLMWSYGLLLLTAFKPYVRGAFAIPPTLPWLISSAIIIGVALHEENELRAKYGELYSEYCKRTPFLMPLPKPLSVAISFPLKYIIKDYPKSNKDIVLIITTYIGICMLLSFVLISIFRYP